MAAPINKADNKANKYACKNATNNSSTEMKSVRGTDKPPQAAFWLMKMMEIKAKTIT